MEENMQVDRIKSLIGEKNLNLIKEARVIIIGIGGVGGYALETLVRSGVSEIGIVDFDEVDITNLNRQIITNLNNIGEKKVILAKKRAESISNSVKIKTYCEFLNNENINTIIGNNYDYIIDACDTISTKKSLIEYAFKNNIKIISSMGTAKKLDPTKLRITKLSKTVCDPLAKVLRKTFKNEKYYNKINVVSSEETSIKTQELGSLMMVPATAGILCAKFVIDDIIDF